MRPPRAIRRATLLAALLLLATALVPAISSAYFGIQPGSVQVQALDSTGEPDNRAGGHPDHISFDFVIDAAGEGTAARDLIFEFAPGLTGSPIATPLCSRAEFELGPCPDDTQVGVFIANFLGGESFEQPIYNIKPAPNQLAALGFKPFWQSELEMGVRPDDFGLSLTTLDMPQLPFENGHVELWGIPADHNGATTGRKAFLTTPTDCAPIRVKILARSWQVGAHLVSEEGESEPFTGCESLPFEPSLAMQLTSSKPDSPTGARIELNLAGRTDPDEQSSASLKDVKIDLPPGLGVSPGGVQGREACTDQQFGLGEETPVSCPFLSRVGSVEVRTPELASNLVGSIYLGRERPGERFRLLVQASAPGIAYKAVAQLVPNRQTGQLSTVLNGLPQFSIDQISLEFDGGPRALLATPLPCGSSTARAHFVPYSGGPAGDSSSSISIGSGCGSSLPFTNGTIAGSTDLSAGKHTAFELTVTRQEGEQIPKKFSTTLPAGLSPDLTIVKLCPAAPAARGECPETSKIGIAMAEVGSGPTPAKLFGGAYLSEGHEGAPFALAMIFKAAIGPYDLGTLTVMAALRLDPQTGQVILTHPLPSIIEGIPLRFRTLAIDTPRSGGFLTNPTSCDPGQVSSTMTSIDGRMVPISIPFSINGCEALGFRPKFSIALNQRGRRARNPELSFAVTMPKGQANLERFAVKFPPALRFHNAGLNEICPRADAVEDRCRPGARVGTAVAVSPLLGEPLRGPIYVVRPEGGGFPDLSSNIEGARVKLQLRSETSMKRGNLVSEMLEIPDLPLSSFSMHIDARGKKGNLFSIEGDPCADPTTLTTPAELEGHNGVAREMSVQMKAGCSKADRRKRIPHRGRAHSGRR